LKKRDVSNGFTSLARDALSSGETSFSEFSGEVVLSNGSFTVRDAVFVASDYVIDVISDGSLKNWIANTTMHVVYNEGFSVPGFDFSLDGGINIPALDVDGSKVENVYESRWERVANEAKAAEKARIEKYKDLMDKVQDKTDELKEELDTKIVPVFKNQSGLTRDAEIRKRYSQIEEDISRANIVIEEVESKKAMKNIDDNVISSLKKQNAEVANLLKKIKAAIKQVHARDVKLRVNQSYNNIFNTYNKSRVLSSRQLETYGAYDKRLVAIDTDYKTRDDKKVNDWRQQVEDSLLAIDNINAEISKENIIAQSVSDVNELEEYSARFDEAYQKAAYEMAKMEAAAASMNEHLENVVGKEEAAYAQKVNEAEVKRKLEENTGQISTSNGKTIMIERAIDDIVQSENAVKKKEIPVLNFSEETTVSGTVTKSGLRKRTNAEVTRGSSIIKIDANSESSEVGGTIITQ
jgi:hypothetical protein